MLEELIHWMWTNWEYVASTGGIVLGLLVLRFWLIRPTREELEHERRLQGLKERSKDTYRTVRPLK